MSKSSKTKRCAHCYRFFSPLGSLRCPDALPGGWASAASWVPPSLLLLLPLLRSLL